MKVRIDYSDGQYSMTAIELLMPVEEIVTRQDSEYRSYLDSIAIDIPDAEYRRYDRFLKVAARWHNRISALDNEAYAKAHPVDTDQEG